MVDISMGFWTNKHNWFKFLHWSFQVNTSHFCMLICATIHARSTLMDKSSRGLYWSWQNSFVVGGLKMPTDHDGKPWRSTMFWGQSYSKGSMFIARFVCWKVFQTGSEAQLFLFNPNAVRTSTLRKVVRLRLWDVEQYGWRDISPSDKSGLKKCLRGKVAGNGIGKTLDLTWRRQKWSKLKVWQNESLARTWNKKICFSV